MPLGSGVRYRMHHVVRLAFRGRNVIEAKNMTSGATHTPAEFAADRKRRGKNILRKADG
jgi:hypothetical protein